MKTISAKQRINRHCNHHLPATRLIITLLTAILTASGLMAQAADQTTAQPDTQPNTQLSFLDNGKIRIGVNLALGGSITWLSESGSSTNLVNNYDWGRQIQMSFYSGPNPYVPEGATVSPNWKKLGWNPIQSGDYAGHRARVLEHRNDGKSIYVRSIPMQWPLKNVPGECTFEISIRLKDNTAEVVCRLNNDREDTTQYRGRSQEVPAVYTNRPLWKLMTYSGDQPFTNGQLTQIPPIFRQTGGGAWTHYRSTENWSALVNDADWGIGLWSPDTYNAIGGFAGDPGRGYQPGDDPAANGSKSANTGYFAPLAVDILDHNIKYEYRYTLILGTIDEIRGHVYQHAQRPTAPHFTFKKSREHWTLNHAQDQGWPIDGQMTITPTGPRPELLGPPDFWQAADASFLTLEAAFPADVDTVRIRWQRFDDKTFEPPCQADLPVIGDGQMHDYRFDLSQSPLYTGAMQRLRIEPIATPEKMQQLIDENRPCITLRSAIFEKLKAEN